MENVFLNSAEVSTFCGNLKLKLSDHLPKFLFLKISDFNYKFPIGNNEVFEQNYRLYFK